MLVTPRKFPYNASYIEMGLCAAIASAAAYCLAQEAMTNDRGLTIDIIINLDAAGATNFYWILCACCAIGASFAVASMLMRSFRPKELAIDELGLTLPSGFMLVKTTRVNFNEITNLTETKIRRETFLYLHTASAKFTIMASLLPSKDDYEDIKQFLITKFK
jgi:hypothetical protein